MSQELVHSPLTIEVVVKRPLGFARWRWFIAFNLIKLAARFYPFHFQLYRTEELSDRVNLPPS